MQQVAELQHVHAKGKAEGWVVMCIVDMNTYAREEGICRKYRIGSWKQAAGNLKQEVGSGKWEAGSGKQEVGSGKWTGDRASLLISLDPMTYHRRKKKLSFLTNNY